MFPFDDVIVKTGTIDVGDEWSYMKCEVSATWYAWPPAGLNTQIVGRQTYSGKWYSVCLRYKWTILGKIHRMYIKVRVYSSICYKFTPVWSSYSLVLYTLCGTNMVRITQYIINIETIWDQKSSHMQGKHQRVLLVPCSRINQFMQQIVLSVSQQQLKGASLFQPNTDHLQ